MTTYRRNLVHGGRFFFAAALAERRLRLLIGQVDLLCAAFRSARRRHLQMMGFVQLNLSYGLNAILSSHHPLRSKRDNSR